jgi:hypothetical protein
MVPADMFPRTHQTISNLVFSVYTTLPAESRPKRLWMCFRERLREQKNRASRHPCRQKAHFRQAANHRKTLYSSRFSGFYLLFTFDRVEQWGCHRPLIKPYVRFSRIRLSDILLPSAFSRKYLLVLPARSIL